MQLKRGPPASKGRGDAVLAIACLSGRSVSTVEVGVPLKMKEKERERFIHIFYIFMLYVYAHAVPIKCTLISNLFLCMLLQMNYAMGPTISFASVYFSNIHSFLFF
jgi:hypothetical protein